MPKNKAFGKKFRKLKRYVNKLTWIKCWSAMVAEQVKPPSSHFDLELLSSKLKEILKKIKSNKFISNIFLSLSVVQQNMRVTRQIVFPLLTKVLYKFGCFEGILQKARLALLIFY